MIPGLDLLSSYLTLRFILMFAGAILSVMVFLIVVKYFKAESLWQITFLMNALWTLISMIAIAGIIAYFVLQEQLSKIRIDPVLVVTPVFILLVGGLIGLAMKSVSRAREYVPEEVGDEDIHVHMIGDDPWELPPEYRDRE